MTEQQTEPMKAHELAYRLGVMMSAGDDTFTVRYYDSTTPFMIVDTGDEIFTLMIYGPSPKVTEAEVRAAAGAAEAALAESIWPHLQFGKDTGSADESTRADVLLCANVQAGHGGCVLDHGHEGPCEFPAAVHPVGRAVVSVRPPFCGDPYRDDQGGMYCTLAPDHDGPHGQKVINPGKLEEITGVPYAESPSGKVQVPFCAEPYDRGQSGPVYCTKVPGHDGEHGAGAA